MIISTHWLSLWMNVKQICKVLRAVRLFEPDRNEEKWTNEHVYWEQRMSNFFYKRTNNIEVKNTKLPAEKTNKPRTSQETLSFYDWLVSIVNSLHLSLRFDHLRLLHGTVFCLDMVGDQMSKYSRNCLVEHWFFSFWLFFLFFRSQRSGSSGTAKKQL